MSLAPKTRYDGVAMIIHWLTAVLMIYMVFFGEDLIKSGMRAAKAGDAANATFQPSIHVSIGLTILLLTVLRIIWRLTHAAPAYPAGMKRYEVVGSKALHGIFYLLLLGLPITGWLAFGEVAARLPAIIGTSFYGVMQVPPPPFTAGIFGEAHGLGSNLAMALIGLHVLAALKHQFIDKDGIFGRILPW
jgi:cytochrome b561